MDFDKKKDPLAELFRQKLENHQVPVDGSGWAKIKKQLGGNRKTILWSAISAASAAVVVLLFILAPSDRPPVDTRLQMENDSVEIHRGNKRSIASQPQKQEAQRLIADNTIAEKRRVAVSQEQKNVNFSVERGEVESESAHTDEAAAKEKQAQEHYQSILSPTTEVLVDNGNTALSIDVEETKGEVSAEVVPEKEEAKKAGNQQVYRANLSPELEDIPPVKSKKNWTLAAAYGGSPGSNGEANDVNIPMRMSSIKEYPAESSNLFVRDYGEGKHYPEMSFSFTVEKRIGSRFAIESGLTYTYLYSKFEKVKNVSGYEVKQHLHYIGIPVNVTAYILDGSSRWNIYASGGFVFEKGIRARYKEAAKSLMNQSQSIDKSEGISGVQWSVNASVGTTYRLGSRFNLFLAPRVSYYFDNNQPESIRTDKDLSFGVNIGLKYDL